MEVIKNEQEKGRTFINKLLAGERQLAAAIRMYFLELDPLAIHIVSSAAHNVLSDLLSDRGKDASIHGIVYGLLRAAKDLHEGVINETEVRAWGDGALELVKQYCALLEVNPEIDIDQISSAAPHEFARAYWSDRRRSYNYLKHADRDASGFLDEATINNEDTIIQAITCSQHLNTKHTEEKHFFYCAMIALGKLPGGGEKPFELEFLMSGFSKDEIMALGRKNLCNASFQNDDNLIECADRKVRENFKHLEGKDIQFIRFD